MSEEFWKGKDAFNSGKFRDAETLLKKGLDAAASDIERANALSGLAACSLATWRISDALGLNDKALALHETPYEWLFKGLCLLYVDRAKEAKEATCRGLELGKGNVDLEKQAHFQLSLVYEKESDYKTALSYLEMAIAESGGKEYLKDNARLLKKAGKPEEAGIAATEAAVAPFPKAEDGDLIQAITKNLVSSPDRKSIIRAGSTFSSPSYSPLAGLSRAEILELRGDVNDAVSDPSAPFFYIEAALARKEYKEAAAKAEDILCGKKSPEALELLGRAQIGLAEYEKALQTAALARLAFPSSDVAEHLEALVCDRKGDNEGALHHFRQMKSEGRGNSFAAALLLSLERNDEALSEIDKAIQIMPLAFRHYIRARALFALGKEEEAVSALGKALQGEEDARYYLLRAKCLGKRDADAALSDLDLAVKTGSGKVLAEALRLRADMLFFMGAFGRAVADCRRFQELTGEEVMQGTLSTSLALMGDPSALVDARTSGTCAKLLMHNAEQLPSAAIDVFLKSRNVSSVLLSNASEAVKRMKQYDFNSAVVLLDFCLKTDPANSLYLVLHAKAGVGAGKLDEALRNLEEALRVSPENVFALPAIAELHAALGETEKAKAELAKYEEVKKRISSSVHGSAAPSA